MPFNIQGPELIILLIIALVIIGPGKLPDVGAALGKSLREFRKAATDAKDATSLEPAKAEPARADATAVASVAPTVAPAAAVEAPATPNELSTTARSAPNELTTGSPAAPSPAESPSEPGR